MGGRSLALGSPGSTPGVVLFFCSWFSPDFSYQQSDPRLDVEFCMPTPTTTVIKPDFAVLAPKPIFSSKQSLPFIHRAMQLHKPGHTSSATTIVRTAPAITIKPHVSSLLRASNLPLHSNQNFKFISKDSFVKARTIKIPSCSAGSSRTPHKATFQQCHDATLDD